MSRISRSEYIDKQNKINSSFHYMIAIMKRTYKTKKYVTKELIPDSIKTSTYLLIVESPSKCKKIESFLGSQYTCIASKGHLRTLNSLKSIDIEQNYTISFNIIEEKKSHIEWMRKIIGNFKKENIILATDDDREGEAISWHICELFELDILKTKRILFHEITQVAIQTALENPTIINMNLVQAQHCRQVLDLFIGYKISPILWKFLYRNKDNSLSAGRCQTPALRLVYDNAEIKKSEALEQVWKVAGYFTNRNLLFSLSEDFKKELDVLKFLELSKTFHHKMIIKDSERSNRSAPKPFHTSHLLQTASSKLHMSPKETMSLCQQLYQDGHITYMRTESQVYSESFLVMAKEYIDKRFSKGFIEDIDMISNKSSGNPHEAIRVTHIENGSLDVENNRLVSLYRMIWQNTVESCMKHATYEVTKVNISAPLDLHYNYTIEIPIDLGWKIVSSKDSIVDQQNKGNSLLLFLRSTKSPISYSSIETSINVKGRHSYYTEAALIKKLEDQGIGRPSTFASIVETNLERGYIKKMDIIGEEVVANEHKLEWGGNIIIDEKKKIIGDEKNKLVIQPIGILTIDFLVEVFSSLFSYDYTKKLELELDNIANGLNNTWYKVCDDCLKEITDKIKKVQKLGKQIFTISDGYEIVFEKYGPVLRKMDEGSGSMNEGSMNKGSQKYSFYSVKKDINVDLGKLQRGEYTLADLKEEETLDFGEYKGSQLLVKTGPYGKYIEWNSKKISIKSMDSEIKKEDLYPFLEPSSENIETKNILRELTSELSIRKGKFGAYVYYKTNSMSKPQFYNIQKFKESYHHCSIDALICWINKTYKLSIPNNSSEKI